MNQLDRQMDGWMLQGEMMRIPSFLLHFAQSSSIIHSHHHPKSTDTASK
jgi:hypothetical protein